MPRAKKKLTPPLKWPGGKDPLAARIVALFPPKCENPNDPDPDDPGYLAYVEPYFGGGAVLLVNDPEGVSEVANDLHGDLTVFWRVLADEGNFRQFLRRAQATPFSEPEWRREAEAVSRHGTDMKYVDAVERAFRFFVRCRQSRAGGMKAFAPLTRQRTRRGMNEQASAWLGAVDGLPAVHERLKRVVVLNRDALDVIRSEDGPRTLFYLDPPYLHETRATTGEYEHEMTYEQHVELLDTLTWVKGRFLLSGYPSALYQKYATDYGWYVTAFKVDNKAAGGKKKRRMTECVWRNFA